MSAIFRVLIYLPGKIASYLSRVDMESGGVLCPSAVYFQTHNPERKRVVSESYRARRLGLEFGCFHSFRM